MDGQPPKRNQGFRINFYFQKKNTYKIKTPLKRFPFKFEERLGSGGIAAVYKGLFHGEPRAFKVIPTDNEENAHNIKSYGCHEYYNQENDLKSKTTLKVDKFLIKSKRLKRKSILVA